MNDCNIEVLFTRNNLPTNKATGNSQPLTIFATLSCQGEVRLRMIIITMAKIPTAKIAAKNMAMDTNITSSTLFSRAF